MRGTMALLVGFEYGELVLATKLELNWEQGVLGQERFDVAADAFLKVLYQARVFVESTLLRTFAWTLEVFGGFNGFKFI